MSLGYDVEFVRRRYNRLAPIYPLFEVLFVLPRGIRARAVERLRLNSGDTVLEMGCGTGRNLRHLVRAVGPTGRVYGIDYSEGMLGRARELCDRLGLYNVTLLRQDAARMALPEPVDGILFSLCYAVFPEPRRVLAQAWSYLRRGRHVVVLDGKLAAGLLGKVSRPLVRLAMRATVLGDPDIRPWDDLKELTPDVEMEVAHFGTYYICRARKL